MRCLECGSEAVTERPERTAQGYRRFRCRVCGKQFNERSGGVLNRTQYPSDVIALVVLWRLRYKLSLRDLPEMFAIRGIMFSYEAVREWEAKLTPALAEELRRRRRGKVGRSWYVDETYLKVHGRWCYLYRAIDRNGHLVDVLFSEHRDMAAAQAFFRSAKAVTGIMPDRVTTDGHDSYPRAIRTELGKGVRGGFKWSSQQLCALISAARQRPRPVFSTQASYAAGRSASRPRRQELPGCACSGQCPWGSTAAEARWCSRSCHAARGCADRRSRLARQCRSATACAGPSPLPDPRSASVAVARARW